ncbi:MAG: dTDP-4-dehydrorhamnose reductase [Rhodocyclaceae bacterium]|nr:dTDP-4-dehydrorhamnose reductase [Rhodocyclaceae bacterium]
MKRILLTGRNGQVGWELERTLAPLGEVFAFDHGGLDLADADCVRRIVRDTRPDIVVNAAAYTAVDRAESEADRAMAINAAAPGLLAEEAKRLGALLVHYSTDYVFDGTKDSPYAEDDATNPLGVYGRSKLAGEQAIQASGCRHLIFRTSWVYGLRGNNFLRTIRRLAAERDELRIVDDQVGAPTWSRMIAMTTALSLQRSREGGGIYHLTSTGAVSWHGFAAAILAMSPRQERAAALVAIPSRDYPLPAARPKNSRLDCSRLAADFDLTLPDWNSALRLCLGGIEAD